MKFFIGVFLFLIFLLNLTLIAQKTKTNPDLMPAFSVSPTEIKLVAQPGQTIKSSFLLVTKNYKNFQDFTLTPLDLGQESFTGPIPVDAGKGVKSCVDWLNIEREVRAKPDDRLEIPFSIKVPYDVKGNYFAYVDVSTRPKRPAGQFVVLLKYRLPIKIELSIPGPALLRLNARELGYEPEKANQKSAILLKVANEGEWKTSVTGDIVIREIGTGHQEPVPIPYVPNTAKAITIYPGIELPIRCELSKPLKRGNYIASVRMFLNQFARAQAHFEFSVADRDKTTGRLSIKEEFDLEVSATPNLIELPLRPGARRTIPIRIKNNNKIPVDLNLELKRATMAPGGSFCYQESIPEDTISNWLEITPKSFQLNPMQATALKTNITIPDDYQSAFESIHVIIIKADRSLEGIQDTTTEWLSRGEQSIPILLYDALATPAQLECAKFDIIQHSKDLNPTAGIIQVRNTGGKLARVKGIMSLKNKDGKEYAYMDIGKFQPELIMPGGEREFRFEIPTLDDGEFSLFVELGLAGQKEKIVLNEQRSFTAVAKRPEGL